MLTLFPMMALVVSGGVACSVLLSLFIVEGRVECRNRTEIQPPAPAADL